MSILQNGGEGSWPFNLQQHVKEGEQGEAEGGNWFIEISLNNSCFRFARRPSTLVRMKLLT